MFVARDARREALSLYRAVLRAARRFDFPSSADGPPWSRVLAASVRADFEAARGVVDPAERMRLIVEGTDALMQLEARAAVAAARLAEAVDSAARSGPVGGGLTGGLTGGPRETLIVEASPYALDARASGGRGGGGLGAQQGLPRVALDALARESALQKSEGSVGRRPRALTDESSSGPEREVRWTPLLGDTK